MVGFLDQIDTSTFKRAAKPSKDWQGEVEGRAGVKKPINNWVGKVTGIDCEGEKWDPNAKENLNDKDEPKRVDNVFFEVDGEWMCSVQYGTKRLAQGAVPSVTNIDEAVEGAKQIYKDADSGLYDKLIKQAYDQMAKERAEAKKKAEEKKAKEAAASK